LPSEQRSLVNKVKKQICSMIRLRKIIHLPKSKIVGEAYKIALDELLMEHPYSDITFFQSLKHYKKQFMESM